MMEWMIVGLVLFGVFFVTLRLLWSRVPPSTLTNDTAGVTILIPVRNECATIYDLLEAIDQQDFPMDRLEVLVIDDHSVDDTLEEVRRAARHVRYRIKSIPLSDDQYGKKTALTVGNKKARHNIVLCTDADTLPPPGWVRAMTGLLVHDGYQMVSGPVCMSARTRFEQVQALEFMGLIGFGALTLFHGIPTMCNGANMAYTRTAFREVDGYMDNLHIPSGDDEFLLRKISRRYPGGTTFVKSPQALVTTRAKPGWRSLWSQRVRWVSKWRHHKSMMINWLAILGFGVFAALAGTLAYLACTGSFVEWMVMMAALALSWAVYLHGVTAFFSLRYGWWTTLILTIIYPYYAILLGIASIFGSYSWKGRKYP